MDRNFTTLPVLRFLQVALRKESVDRNGFVGGQIVAGAGRSPQGERG